VVFRHEQEYFPPYHRIHTGSGAHLATYLMDTRSSSLKLKRPEREANYTLPSGAEVKNAWSYASTSPYVFMVWCLVNHRDFTFTFLVYENRDSSVGIALGYRLDDRRSRVRFPAEAGNFSIHQRVQNDSGPHQASYPMGTRSSFPGDEAVGA
jgi:hypothetical protein